MFLHVAFWCILNSLDFCVIETGRRTHSHQVCSVGIYKTRHPAAQCILPSVYKWLLHYIWKQLAYQQGGTLQFNWMVGVKNPRWGGYWPVAGFPLHVQTGAWSSHNFSTNLRIPPPVKGPFNNSVTSGKARCFEHDSACKRFSCTWGLWPSLAFTGPACLRFHCWNGCLVVALLRIADVSLWIRQASVRPHSFRQTKR